MASTSLRSGDGFAGDDLAADGRLDPDLEQLARDHFRSFATSPAVDVGPVAVDDEGERVHRLAVDQDVQLDQVGGPVADEFVVEEA